MNLFYHKIDPFDNNWLFFEKSTFSKFKTAFLANLIDFLILKSIKKVDLSRIILQVRQKFWQKFKQKLCAKNGQNSGISGISE